MHAYITDFTCIAIATLIYACSRELALSTAAGFNMIQILVQYVTMLHVMAILSQM